MKEPTDTPTPDTPASPAGGDHELTAKERAFVREYPVDYNATQAALRAGYSQKTAPQIGYQLLHKTSVAAAIEAQIARLAQLADVQAVEYLRELNAVALSRYSHFRFNARTGRLTLAPGAPPTAEAALRSVKIKPVLDAKGEIAAYSCELTMWDKPGTLIRLGQQHGLLPLPGAAPAAPPPGEGEAPKPAMRVVVERDQRTLDRLARRAASAARTPRR